MPRRGLESRLCLMHLVELLRLPLAFGRAHAVVTLSEGGAVATMRVWSPVWRSAASKVVMRSGRHFAQFTVVQGKYMIRPGWGVEGAERAHQVDGHCFFNTGGGYRWPGNGNWEGKQGANDQGGRIDMLLDLDQGSMTAWKNDEKRGVMQAEGLSGPYCWAVSMISREGSARIESAPLPEQRSRRTNMKHSYNSTSPLHIDGHFGRQVARNSMKTITHSELGRLPGTISRKFLIFIQQIFIQQTMSYAFKR